MTATRTPPEAPARRGPTRPPPRLGFLLAGLALAAVVASILFATSGGNDGSAASPPVAPGIDTPTAALLSLDVNSPHGQPAAPDFTLTDQLGRTVSLSQFRGKAAVLTFNDDQCPDLCTLLAEDIVVADKDLGPAAGGWRFCRSTSIPSIPAWTP